MYGHGYHLTKFHIREALHDMSGQSARSRERWRFLNMFKYVDK